MLQSSAEYLTFMEAENLEGCDNFWTQVHPWQRQLVLAYVTEGLSQLGCAVDNIEAGHVWKRPTGTLPKHELLLGALPDILVDGGLFE